MKHFSIILLVVLAIFSCENKTADLTVTGTIKGLKKGTVYLQRIQDKSLIVLDSMLINGEETFILHSELAEPEVLYLMLDKNGSEELRIAFFADNGTTEINTSLKKYGFEQEIKGSELQNKLAEFNETLSKFNDRNLDLIKEQFEARQTGDSIKIQSKNNEANGLLKRKYLYAINYAVNNKDSEIAPYIALSELYNANTKYLDTIYNSLPKHIAESKYGKELDVFLKKIKETEKN